MTHNSIILPRGRCKIRNILCRSTIAIVAILLASCVPGEELEGTTAKITTTGSNPSVTTTTDGDTTTSEVDILAALEQINNSIQNQGTTGGGAVTDPDTGSGQQPDTSEEDVAPSAPPPPEEITDTDTASPVPDSAPDLGAANPGDDSDESAPSDGDSGVDVPNMEGSGVEGADQDNDIVDIPDTDDSDEPVITDGNDSVELPEDIEEIEDTDTVEETDEASEFSITSVMVTDIGTSSARVLWSLSEGGTGQVQYGSKVPLTKVTTNESSFNYSNHAQYLNALLPGTTYKYYVRSVNSKGVEKRSSLAEFTTEGGSNETEPDPEPSPPEETVEEPSVPETQEPEVVPESPAETSGFAIISVTTNEITDSGARIQWSLSESGTGQIHFGSEEPLSRKTIEETSLRYDTHSQAINGLLPGTTYTYYVRSMNSDGVERRSSIQEFTTSGGSVGTDSTGNEDNNSTPDTSAFQIMSVASQVNSNSSVKIKWLLSEAGTGQVHYGVSEPLNRMTTEETRLEFDSHIQTISGLEPDTTYKYYVRSVNSSGVIKRSDILEFTTSDPSAEPDTEKAAEETADKTVDEMTEEPVAEDITASDSDADALENTGESGDSTGFDIISVSSSAITSNSIKVQWLLSEPGTGQIHYGVEEPLGNVTAEEGRIQYDFHIQTIRSLQPETTYKYYARSVNASGIERRSAVYEFTTASSNSPVLDSPTMDASVDWPYMANESLPQAGIFYGQQEAGLLTDNASIAIESSRRFRAEKTGFINAVRYNNRTLSDDDINARCLPSSPDSAWCKCVDAGLDKYSCGYTLGNSFTVGNGGSIVIEIRADDETEAHAPAANVLGRTAGTFIPVERADEHFPILYLENSVHLRAGEIYHLVYRNINPPSDCELSGVSITDAVSCPRNQGAMGLNGTYQPVLYGQSRKFGPFGGNSAGNLFRNSTTEPWSSDDEHLSWYEVGYEDGTWVGDSHTGVGSTAEGKQLVGGQNIARQVFTVRDSTRFVDGLWLYYGHDYTYTPDGSQLSVEIMDEAGTILASGSIEPSSECMATSARGFNTGSFREKHCRVWKYTEFDRTVSLLEGETYSAEFSGSTTSGFSLHTFFPLNYGVWQSTSRNQWSDAHAEISSNYGFSWENWAGSYYPERDIVMLFTIDGMPRQLP